jgi:hypothetical protein
MSQLSQTDIVNLALMQLGQEKIQSISNQSDPNAIAANVAWPQAQSSVSRETPWNCLKAPASLGQLQPPTTVTSYNTNIPSTATTWAPGTAYAVNAYVIFAGYLYQCLIANTSSTNFTVDLTRGYWFQTTTFSPSFFGLPPGNTAPGSGWLYAYALPSDFIALVRLNSWSGWGGWGWGYGCGGGWGLSGGAGQGGRSHEIFQRTLYCNAAFANIVYIQYVTDTTLFDSLFVDALVLKLASMMATDLRKDDAALSQRLGMMYERVLAEARTKNAADDRLKRFNPVRGSRFVRARWQSTNG